MAKKSSDWKHLQFNVFMHVLIMFFYKSEKTCFFYLQIDVFNIYDLHWQLARKLPV